MADPFFVLMRVPETKGKTLEELDRDLTGDWSDVYRPTRKHLFGRYRQRIANQKGGRVDVTKVGSISRLVVTFLILYLSLGASRVSAQPAANAGTLLTIDASAPATVPETNYLQMGSNSAGHSPDGRALSVNSRYLILDGKPWLPVMGEFHYTRYPERYWEEEILKMKAGGVQIVATYVFWIHHEEVEGQFDWSGRRDLHKFVELCGKHGMYVYPRIGPWAHGEVRNGGLPDWLLKKGPTRVNDPVYLSYVRRYYGETAKQLKGQLWKDGGPVIGIQIENEYSNHTPNGGAAHISRLKEMAIEAGLDVPLYTVTGWDNAVYPPREVIPVFGGYPDEPWSGSLEELPPDTQGIYQFHVAPTCGNTGILQAAPTKSEEVSLQHYPRSTAELGGGMQVTYHRRPVVDEEDIPPAALTEIGSGVNLLGYYMFQGGANPQGKLTTLQESQATDYPNDLPVKSYDFQAPLREFGQMNGSFRKLKLIHQFIHEFGSELAPMTAVLPNVVPSDPRDTTTLRLAARTQGDSGFVFFNNYLRHYPLPEHKGVQVALKLRSQTITLPREPVDIPSQAYFFWPVNLDLSGALLKYATAQPFASVDDGKGVYYFFTPAPGIAPEFAFARRTIGSLSVHTGGNPVTDRDGTTYITGTKPSTGVAIEVQTHSGKTVRIVLLSHEQAQNSWKVSVGRQEHLLITRADVFADAENIYLRSREANAFSFSILPDFGTPPSSTVALRKTGENGAFTHYTASVEPKNVRVSIERVREAAPSSPVKMGKPFDWRSGPVALAPSDSDFGKGAVWKLTFPGSTLEGMSDVFLDINYVGDVGRLYQGPEMLDDNFYNGTPWKIGLKRFAPDVFDKGATLEILPLRKDAPIYLPKFAWPEFSEKSEVTQVKSVTLTPEYELKLTVQHGVASN